MSTKSEKEHMGKVAALGCCICQRLGFFGGQANVHHIRTGIGMGKRASDFDTIPLCHYHHQGAEGIHGMGRKAWERQFGITEMQLLEETKRALGLKEAA